MTESRDPKRSDARRNRDAILAAALEALTASPDASLNAIAKRAGVANATCTGTSRPGRSSCSPPTSTRSARRRRGRPAPAGAGADRRAPWLGRAAGALRGDQARARRRPAQGDQPRKRPVLHRHLHRDRRGPRPPAAGEHRRWTARPDLDADDVIWRSPASGSSTRRALERSAQRIYDIVLRGLQQSIVPKSPRIGEDTSPARSGLERRVGPSDRPRQVISWRVSDA